MRAETKKRIWLYSVASCIAAILLSIILLREYNYLQCRRSVQLLRPLIAADQRFGTVRVRTGTAGKVTIFGELRSSELEALKRLVEDAQPPRRPNFSVMVLPDPNERSD